MSLGCKTEEDLAELWEKFTLTEVEQDGLEAVEEEVEGISLQGTHCLVLIFGAIDWQGSHLEKHG